MTTPAQTDIVVLQCPHCPHQVRRYGKGRRTDDAKMPAATLAYVALQRHIKRWHPELEPIKKRKRHQFEVREPDRVHTDSPRRERHPNEVDND